MAKLKQIESLFTFKEGGQIIAGQLNANFDALKQGVNNTADTINELLTVALNFPLKVLEAPEYQSGDFDLVEERPLLGIFTLTRTLGTAGTRQNLFYGASINGGGIHSALPDSINIVINIDSALSGDIFIKGEDGGFVNQGVDFIINNNLEGNFDLFYTFNELDNIQTYNIYISPKKEPIENETISNIKISTVELYTLSYIASSEFSITISGEPTNNPLKPYNITNWVTIDGLNPYTSSDYNLIANKSFDYTTAQDLITNFINQFNEVKLRVDNLDKLISKTDEGGTVIYGSNFLLNKDANSIPLITQINEELVIEDLSSSDVGNSSSIPGESVTDALDFLDSSKVNIINIGIDYTTEINNTSVDGSFKIEQKNNNQTALGNVEFKNGFLSLTDSNGLPKDPLFPKNLVTKQYLDDNFDVSNKVEKKAVGLATTQKIDNLQTYIRLKSEGNEDTSDFSDIEVSKDSIILKSESTPLIGDNTTASLIIGDGNIKANINGDFEIIQNNPFGNQIGKVTIDQGFLSAFDSNNIPQLADQPHHVTTKQYVDTKIQGVSGAKFGDNTSTTTQNKAINTASDLDFVPTGLSDKGFISTNVQEAIEEVDSKLELKIDKEVIGDSYKTKILNNGTKLELSKVDLNDSGKKLVVGNNDIEIFDLLTPTTVGLYIPTTDNSIINKKYVDDGLTSKADVEYVNTNNIAQNIVINGKVSQTDYDADKTTQSNKDNQQDLNLANEITTARNNELAIYNKIVDTETLFKIYDGTQAAVPINSLNTPVDIVVTSKGSDTDIPTSIAILSGNVFTWVKPYSFTLVSDFTVSAFNGAINKVLEMQVYKNNVLLTTTKGFLRRKITANGVYSMVTSVSGANFAVGDTMTFKWVRPTDSPTGNMSISLVTHEFRYVLGTTSGGGASLSSEIIDDVATKPTEGINTWKTQIDLNAANILLKIDKEVLFDENVKSSINNLGQGVILHAESNPSLATELIVSAGNIQVRNLIDSVDSEYIPLNDNNIVTKKYVDNSNLGKVEVNNNTGDIESNIGNYGGEINLQTTDNLIGTNTQLRIFKDGILAQTYNGTELIPFYATQDDHLTSKKYVDDKIQVGDGVEPGVLYLVS